ncbi:MULTISPECIES: DUF421 domain-containing protein [Bacillaceae]|uniref:DUF421 domain-containing protein n=1 Tax=Bacillaceae TaxID=186817 RepID=UPI001C586FBB|nr:DUF421 domain-containing protein [Rossellomorea sp. YZS02]MBW3112070.1 DUF421 domain-containing protein [Bacillus sp. MCCB 382]MDX8344718.1 DUF421 domain-containing protein [Rossellomorea sp. YZS02]
MDFFMSQHSLTAMEWIFRAAIGFIFLLVITKLMGQRSISQLRFLDFVMALLIGNIMAHPLSDEGLGMKGSMLTMGTLVFLYLIGVYLSLHSTIIRKILDPSPISIIYNGDILYKNLKKARIPLESLLSELRKQQIEEVHKVAIAMWEPGGEISFFLKPQYQPVTHQDVALPFQAFDLPIPIIEDGRINLSELLNLNKDVSWLHDQLRSSYDATVHDVLLATIDKQDQIKIYLYK